MLLFTTGERLRDDEVDILVQGMEDKLGKINYEGRYFFVYSQQSLSESLVSE